MVATPVLAGALLRILLGILVDHPGPKWTGGIAQIAVIGGLPPAGSFGICAVPGILLVACASFAVALPLAALTCSPEHQGTALGIAGARNSLTLLFALSAPGLAVRRGGKMSWASRLRPALATTGGRHNISGVCARHFRTILIH
ncbi:MAG: hypothetical protein J2P48_21695 [Alphaproteobacteria bacterium]|nr:hypothetical protein [Alphaproteobacteria bacterium]